MKLILGIIIFLFGVCLGFGLKQPEVITKVETKTEVVRAFPEDWQPGKFCNDYMNGELEKKLEELEQQKELILQGFREGLGYGKEYS